MGPSCTPQVCWVALTLDCWLDVFLLRWRCKGACKRYSDA